MMKTFLSISLLTTVATTSFAQTFKRQRLDSLLNLLEQKDKYMGSIAVSQHGQLLYARAIGYSDIATGKKADTNTKYRIGSISKMFTASLMMRAVEEKKITLTQTLDKYFPQVENASKITIREMLTHRSGIHNFTNDSSYLTYYSQPKTEKEMLAIIAATKSDFEPDTKAEYSNSNYVLLTYILQKIYGKPYAELLKTKITQPLGLTNTYFGGKINLSANECYSYTDTTGWEKATETDLSIPQGAGAIVATPTDLTVFIEKLFTGKIVSSATLDTMKVIRDKFGIGMLNFPYYEKWSYGHTGGIDGFQSMVVYFPEEQLCVAITGNGIGYPNNSILLFALSCYFDHDFPLPVLSNIKLSNEALDQFTGTYGNAQIPIKIKITRTGNKLVSQGTGQAPLTMETITATTFSFDPAGIILEFDVAKKQMIVKQGGHEFPFTKE
ncbi:serine hydrolase domain-containing protein [Chitinophaga sp. Hz27]|uniref:serine hydrolase domain-containing protein n=1 Tax=Chitinophaga sp. Hz27 TaxID=3347169 RepID=UPI0035D8431C